LLKAWAKEGKDWIGWAAMLLLPPWLADMIPDGNETDAGLNGTAGSAGIGKGKDTGTG
jgi:hypothetical protein